MEDGRWGRITARERGPWSFSILYLPSSILVFSFLVILVIVILIEIVGVERVIRVVEEVAEAHGGEFAAEGLFFALGEGVEVDGVFAEALDEGFLPGLVAADGVLGVAGHALDGVAEHVDAVSRAEVEF